MIHGKKISFNGSMYLKKPHLCPKCGAQLEPIVVKKVVNSECLKDKQYDFRLRGHRGLDRIDLKGNVEFSWKMLKCPLCNHQLTIDEMQQIEYEKFNNKHSDRVEKIKVVIFMIALIIIAILLIVCAIIF